jgi:sarcosine oxidase delta subunit
VATTWHVAGVHDFDADGDADILWRNDDGRVVTWEMEDAAFVRNHSFGSVSQTWQISGTGAFDV